MTGLVLLATFEQEETQETDKPLKMFKCIALIRLRLRNTINFKTVQ